MESIQIGIVGCGHIANHTHLPVYSSLDNVSVIAICDQDKSRLADTKEQHAVECTYTDVSNMIREADLDIVDICVPPHLHESIAIEALENDNNIFIEKPMALTPESCQKIVSTADRQNKRVGVMHNKIFNKPFVKAKRKVESGEIGDVIRLRIFSSNPREDMLDKKDHWYHELPGGIVGETLPHIVYMAQEFMSEIESVDIFAKNKADLPWAPHDEFEVIFEAPDSICSASLSYTSNVRASQVDIIGTDGVLNINLTTNELVVYRLSDLDFQTLGMHSAGVIFQHTRNAAANAWEVIAGDAEVGSNSVLKQFVQSIRDGTEPPVTGLDGYEVVETVDAVVNSYVDKYGEQPELPNL